MDVSAAAKRKSKSTPKAQQDGAILQSAGQGILACPANQIERKMHWTMLNPMLTRPTLAAIFLETFAGKREGFPGLAAFKSIAARGCAQAAADRMNRLRLWLSLPACLWAAYGWAGLIAYSKVLIESTRL